MTGNVESFRQGTIWYRNGINLAKKWKNEIIEIANDRIQTLHAESQSWPLSGLKETFILMSEAVRESDISEDELALDQLTSRSLGKRRRMG